MKPVVTTLVFCVRRNEILLAMKKRGFGVGKWNGAGGKLDVGETPEQAMIRECQEEIGLTPTTYEQVAFHDFVLQSDTDTPWHQHNYTYLCTAWEGDPVETEEMKPQWFATTNIPYEDMWDDDIHWLPQVLAGKKLKTTFTFDSHDHMRSKEIQEVDAL